MADHLSYHFLCWFCHRKKPLFHIWDVIQSTEWNHHHLTEVNEIMSSGIHAGLHLGDSYAIIQIGTNILGDKSYPASYLLSQPLRSWWLVMRMLCICHFTVVKLFLVRNILVSWVTRLITDKEVLVKMLYFKVSFVLHLPHVENNNSSLLVTSLYLYSAVFLVALPSLQHTWKGENSWKSIAEPHSA